MAWYYFLIIGMCIRDYEGSFIKVKTTLHSGWSLVYCKLSNGWMNGGLTMLYLLILCPDLSYDFVIRDYFLYFSNLCSNLLVDFFRRQVNKLVCKLARRLYIQLSSRIWFVVRLYSTYCDEWNELNLLPQTKPSFPP